MKYKFTAYGHRNIRAGHKSTLEITKDKDISVKGDCIVGVGADFSYSKIKKMVDSYGELDMRMRCDGVFEQVRFKSNKKFADKRELVMRLGDFVSDRTLGTNASKSAMMLNRRFVGLLKKGKKMNVEIEPLVKVLIFDFDDTLEPFTLPKHKAQEKIAKIFLKEFGVYPPTTYKMIDDLDNEFVYEGRGKTPDYFDRRVWFAEFFRRIGVKVLKKDIQRYADAYWSEVLRYAKLFPGTKAMLRRLRKDYFIVVLTDADGPKCIKMERMKKLGMTELVDYIVVGNDVGRNKPDKRLFEYVMGHFGVNGEECVMVGDKPWADLESAKKLGMKTVWVRQGSLGKIDKHYMYVDHEIETVGEVEGLLKDL
ncbi:HAD-IA family hydrolase [Nanoarchaeota archaeon]